MILDFLNTFFFGYENNITIRFESFGSCNKQLIILINLL